MFTGIIEEQGKVKEINRSKEGMELTIECKKVVEDVKLGSSICTNGICLSVINYTKDTITLQVSNETIKCTNIMNIKINDMVNLERALTPEKRIDGHIVSGHIDTTAQLTEIKDDGFSKTFTFKIPQEYAKYIVYKGSVSINGVSLTVASAKDDKFSVELIPITLKEVNLSGLKKGDYVNIETDIFAKYVEKILNSKDNKSKIDYDFLVGNGFN